MVGISRLIQQLGAEKRPGLMEKILTVFCVLLILVAMIIVMTGIREIKFPLDYIMNATEHINTTFLYDTMRRLDYIMNATEYITHSSTTIPSV